MKKGNNNFQGSNNSNRRKQQAEKELTFHYVGKAIWYPLNKVEKEQAKEKYTADVIDDTLTKLLDSGYGLSVKPTNDEGLKISLLGYEGDNEGLMLTVTAGSFLFGVRCLLYRHFDTFNEVWRTYEIEE